MQRTSEIKTDEIKIASRSSRSRLRQLAGPMRIWIKGMTVTIIVLGMFWIGTWVGYRVGYQDAVKRVGLTQSEIGQNAKQAGLHDAGSRRTESATLAISGAHAGQQEHPRVQASTAQPLRLHGARPTEVSAAAMANGAKPLGFEARLEAYLPKKPYLTSAEVAAVEPAIMTFVHPPMKVSSFLFLSFLLNACSCFGSRTRFCI